MHFSTKEKFFLLILIIIGTIFSSPIIAEEAPPQVIQAAKDGLFPILQSIPVSSLPRLGLSYQELDQAQLGTGFQVYTIFPEDLFNYKKGTSVSDLISSIDMWFFPIIIKGESKALLRVVFLNGEWTAAGIGGSTLAKNMSGAISKLSTDGINKYIFVSIFPASSDFLIISMDTQEKILPLDSTLRTMKLEKKAILVDNLYEPSVILDGLNQVVKTNIEWAELNPAE